MTANRMNKVFFVSLLFLFITLSSCKNSVIQTWWDNKELSELFIGEDFQMKSDLAELLQWIKENVQNNTYYTIQLNSDYTIIPEDGLIHFDNALGVTLCLIGKNGERSIYLFEDAKGPLFDVGSGTTFILSQNITLKGHDGNNTSLVMVSSGGTLIIKDGAAVRDNTVTNQALNGSRDVAGGIYVDGTLIMEGGIVTGNKSNDAGGGIAVNNGAFTMNGGSVSNNEAYAGAGICTRGIVTMNGGVISGNTIIGPYSSSWTMGGGGVTAWNSGSFTKTGGIIYGSDAPNGLANIGIYQGHGGGDAVFSNLSGNRFRNSTLYENDNISTTNWNIGWE